MSRMELIVRALTKHIVGQLNGRAVQDNTCERGQKQCKARPDLRLMHGVRAFIVIAVEFFRVFMIHIIQRRIEMN